MVAADKLLSFSIGGFLVLIGAAAFFLFLSFALPNARGATDSYFERFPETDSCKGGHWVCYKRVGGADTTDKITVVAGNRGHEVCVETCNAKYEKYYADAGYNGDCSYDDLCVCKCVGGE